jgi:hypothetical protein
MDILSLHDKPSGIWNMDETSFTVDATRGKIIGETGSKGVCRVSPGTGRLTYTVVACVAADGSKAPPLIIFPGNDYEYCCY